MIGGLSLLSLQEFCKSKTIIKSKNSFEKSDLQNSILLVEIGFKTVTEGAYAIMFHHNNQGPDEMVQWGETDFCY